MLLSNSNVMNKLYYPAHSAIYKSIKQKIL